MDDIKITVALISGAVSIVTVLFSFLLKAWFERHFVIFKLEAEHQYEQKKQIKGVIAKNKTSLLDAAESLNHRLWNFSANYTRNWHILDDDYKKLPDYYYLASFVYRILHFFAWVRRIETQMVYIDATVASPNDITFIKFLRVINQSMCDTVLFDGLEYNEFYATDHFFRNDFNYMCECFWNDEDIVSYAEFKNGKNSCLIEAEPMALFLNGMNPEESRYRWDRLQVLHYLLIMFLNVYGYDFQQSNQEKIDELLSRSTRPNKTITNLERILSDVSLTKNQEVKNTLKILKKL